ncbi:MAG: carboxypeptidase regulatory-like domain-containing protein [Wenzhouxiangella sp.]|nr:carboxypeptidase regulatory-like domain-containing protein [Wenzhouxiangella sp.]
MLLVFTLPSLLAAPAVAADRTWTGLGETSHWSEPANWSDNAVPGPTDRAIFNATSTKDAVINSDFSIQAMTVEAGYTGSITQGTSALTLVNGVYSQAGGHFIGGSGPISFSSTFMLSGGTFTASSGTTSFGSSFNQTGGTWESNGGTVAYVSNFDFNIIVNAPAILELNDVLVNLGNNLTRMQPSSGTTARVNGTLTFISGQLSGSGVLEARGEVVIPATHTSIEGGFLRFAGDAARTITIPSGAQLSNLEINAPNTTVTTSGTGLVTLGSVQLINAAQFTNAAADLEVRPGRSWVQSGGSFNAGSGQLDFRSLFTQGGGSFVAGDVPMAVGGAFSLSGGDFSASSGITSFRAAFSQTGGGWNANGGTVRFIASFDINISVSPPGLIDFNDMEVNLGNNLNRLVPVFDTTVVVNGTLTFASGQLSGSGVLEARGEVLIPANHTSVEGGFLRVAGDAPRTITIPSGAQLCNLEINAPNTIITTSGSGLVTLGSVQLIDNAGFTNAAADLEVRPGRTWVQSGGVFTAGSGSLAFRSPYTHSGGAFAGSESNITIVGNFILSGGDYGASSSVTAFGANFSQSGGTWNHNGGTVLFNGVSFDQITVIDGTEFNRFQLNKPNNTNPLSIPGDNLVVVRGETALLSGSFQASGGFTFQGTLEVHGDLIIGEDLTGGTANFRFAGDNDQSYVNLGGINPTGVWTIAKPGGSLLLQSDLDLSNGFVGQALNLSQGTITTGQFTLLAGPRAVNRSSGHIIGNLQRRITATGNRAFPIGTSSGHAPVNVNVTALIQNPSELRVGLIDTPHPRLDPASSLGAHWQLTEFGNITANITLNYLQDDVAGDEESYRLLAISEDTLSVFVPPQVTINTATNIISASNITEFSDWALAEPAQPVSIAPVDPTVPPEGEIEFSALAGYPPHEFELIENNSGASFDPETRLYTAGTTLGAIDVVRVIDSFGFFSESSITVKIIPTRVVITAQPEDTVAGQAFDPAIRVELQDDEGRLDELSTVAISISLADNPGDGELSGVTTLATTDGVAIFEGLIMERAADGYTLAASSVGLIGDLSTPFSILPSEPLYLFFSVQPSDTLPDQIMTPPVEVRIEDDFGNLATQATHEITLSLMGGAGHLSGTLTRPPKEGIAVFDDLSIDLPDPDYRLLASTQFDELQGDQSEPFQIIDPLVVTNTHDSGVGSLRFAIETANASPEAATIRFDIFGTEPHLIQPATPLPPITTPLSIDARTQPGYNGTPLVVLVGPEDPVQNAVALQLVADHGEIAGLSIHSFKIAITMSSEHNRIIANYIGLDPSGHGDWPNQQIGLVVAGHHNIIGGPELSDRNIISGFSSQGIQLSSYSFSHGHTIEGNYIGTDPSGSVAIPNRVGITSVGPFIESLPENLIRHNIISGNEFIAIQNLTNALVEENQIGLGVGSQTLEGSTQGGILVGNSASNGAAVRITRNRVHISPDIPFRGINLNGSLNPRVDIPGSSLNKPRLSRVTVGHFSLEINGSLSAEPDKIYAVEVFASSECGMAGHGPGEVYLGTIDVFVGASGIAAISNTLQVEVDPNAFITATSTDLEAGTTSEFSRCIKAAPAFYNISGRMLDQNGQPPVGPFLQTQLIQPPLTTPTRSTGHYGFGPIVPAGSSLMITPVSSAYSFFPTSRGYSNLSGDQVNQDFTATPNVGVRGQVRVQLGGSFYALSGVQMEITGPEARTLQSDANGRYSANLNPGNYTITPQLENYVFDPPFHQADASFSDQHEFTAIPINVASGRLAIRSGKSLVLMNADGSARVTLGNLANGSDVTYSPDGSKLAWTERVCSSGECRSRIFIANFDGTQKRPLRLDATSALADLHSPAWSPDGSQIAYIIGDSSITISDANTGLPVRGFRAGAIGTETIHELRWASSGNQLVYVVRPKSHSTHSQLFSISALGGARQALTDTLTTVRNARPAFSVDGIRVLFGRRSAGSNSFGNSFGINGAGNTSILTVNSTGGGFVTLPMPANLYDQVSWSPDGTRLGLTANSTSELGITRNRLWIYTPDGTFQQRFGVPDGRLAWGRAFAPVTPPGGSVEVTAGAVSIVFDQVNSVGETSVVPIPPGSAGLVPGGFVIGEYGAWEIATTAIVQPPIVLCFVLSDFSGTSFQFGKLSVMHNENGVLVDRTVSRTFAARTLCASVDSLSPFVIAEAIDEDLPTISGLVMDGEDKPLAGISILMSGSQERSTVSDSNGYFSFPNLLLDGNYSVRPRARGVLFSEYSVDFLAVESDQAAIFVGIEADFSIAGRVVDASGNGLADIEVIAEGDTYAYAVTNQEGYFVFDELPADGSYLVRATAESLQFLPTELLIEPLVGDVEGLELLVVPLPAGDPIFTDRFQGGR